MIKSGSTLIELLIYIAISSVLATVTVELASNLVRARVKSNVQQIVVHNLRFSTRRIQHEIMQANSLISATPTKICLSSSDTARSPIQIYSSGGSIYLGTSGTCATPTTTFALNSNNVQISNLVFSNTTTPSSDHIDFSFDLNYQSASSRAEWNYAASATGSATIR